MFPTRNRDEMTLSLPILSYLPLIPLAQAAKPFRQLCEGRERERESEKKSFSAAVPPPPPTPPLGK